MKGDHVERLCQLSLERATVVKGKWVACLIQKCVIAKVLWVWTSCNPLSFYWFSWFLGFCCPGKVLHFREFSKWFPLRNQFHVFVIEYLFPLYVAWTLELLKSSVIRSLISFSKSKGVIKTKLYFQIIVNVIPIFRILSLFLHQQEWLSKQLIL